ncbi:hypothetical protein N7G274_000794 [Stereocaulon virgatum]|uniref:Uncharacterized protein n=1 Tax=Stereocaulon virgatum TaxID=373712 RepID=A0ABR4APN4_9LECA
MIGKRSKEETEPVEPKLKKLKPTQNDLQIRQVEDVSDSEEDHGHLMNAQFLAAPKQSTRRSNAALIKFSQTVDKRKQRLYDLLDERGLKFMEEDKDLHRSIFTISSRTYSNDLEMATAMPKSVLKNTTIAKSLKSTVYNASRSGIVLSRDLLAHYDRGCQQITSVEGILRIKSGPKGDLQILQSAIDQQGEKIKSEVGQYLYGSRKPTKEHPGGDASVGDDEIWSRLAVIGATSEEGKTEKNGGTGWAVTAKQMQRGVRRIIKHLPEDSE